MRLDAGQIEMLDQEMAEVLRSKSPAERLAIANGMWLSARRLISNTLQAEHPEWDAGQIAIETARRLSHGAD
jgi:hypothetical protein